MEEEYYEEEEEVVEVDQDDDSSMGDEELIESVTANLRALQMERKHQQQHLKQQEKPSTQSDVHNGDNEEGDEEALEEEWQETVIEEEVVSLQGSASPLAAEDGDQQSGSVQEQLLESQATFESVYTDASESPRRQISRCSSTVIEEIPISSQDEDDEYEEQVIEQWFRRDEIPDDLETACRALIPIVYRGEESANDPDRMIRRTPLKELYLYLRQHYTFQKEVQKKELEELPKESVHQQQTSLEDLMGQRQRQQGLQQQKQQEQEAKLAADSFDDSETIMEVIVDDSSTILIEEDMESLCSPTRWMSPRSRRLGVEVRSALENATLLEESQYTEVLVDENDSGVSQVEEDTVYEEILSPVSRKSIS